MKIAIFVFIAFVVFGIGIFTLMSDTVSDDSDIKTTAAISPHVLGHVTVQVTDFDGEIKHYSESDNEIVNGGENCVLKMMFGPKSGTGIDLAGNSVCIGAITEPFTTISVGTDATTATDLHSGLLDPITGSGLDPSVGSVTWINATDGGAAQIVITKQFAVTGTVSNISETGLFNGTTTNTNGMFARQTFTPVSVTNQDTLTVIWTISVG